MADDRAVDPTLGKAVADVLSQATRFGAAPFARDGAWRYVAGHPPFNIAEGLPRELLRALSEPQAAKDAMDAPAARIVTDHQLHLQNFNLRQTRDLLLPGLLSGQLRLAEAKDNPMPQAALATTHTPNS